MDAPTNASYGDIIFDIQITRRRILAAREWALWPPELKQRALDAEARLKAVNGADLVRALVERGRELGARVKI